MNGLDFWNEGATNSCNIVHEKFLAIQSGRESGTIQSADNWMARDGTVVCTDLRTMRIYNRPDDQRLFDFEITLQAPPDKPVIFGDDKDGTMAARIAETMRLKHKDKHRRRTYCPVLGRAGRSRHGASGRIGAIITGLWMGKLSGSPSSIIRIIHGIRPGGMCGIMDSSRPIHSAFMILKKSQKGRATFTIPAGQSVTFRYRFYLHKGDEQQARVAEQYQEYSRTRKP